VGVVESRELIYRLTKKDFEITHYKGSGPGGQNRNKNSTAVRIKHPESGATASCSEHKSQLQNRKVAFRRLIETPQFKIWHARKVHEYSTQKTIEQEIEELMKPHNIKTEVKDGQGKWIETKESDWDSWDEKEKYSKEYGNS